MKKNNKSTKQRRAQANRGKKNSEKSKKIAGNKHVRAEKRRKEMADKQRRLEMLIQKLSNQEQDPSGFANVTPSANDYNNDKLFQDV